MDTFGYLGIQDHTNLCAHMCAHIRVLVGLVHPEGVVHLKLLGRESGV